ncbi:hypothetical protein NMY3_03391 [Candidatus Nitrosocosmicus oleophilus]|uniref:Uncharacterized protein n=1 Tax=Candidatus Nitrosocosmicus oleophilus TaxID=1353260 RepID=A0A654M172_9ARCH|nr:hypothetical protein NMY3_03391 [Candidatus Nitrosocosmicus oleophilus]
MLSYDRLSRKPTLFKSFTRTSVKQLDDIYKIMESISKTRDKTLLTIREIGRKSCWGWLVDDVSNWMLKTGLSIIMVLAYYRPYTSHIPIS